MVRTKALTRGLFLRILNRVWDSDGNLEFDFLLHARELQAPPERSINMKGICVPGQRLQRPWAGRVRFARG